MGDLKWNKEFELMCPGNPLGEVDAYLVSHHGSDTSGSAALVHALRPRAAIMNNGREERWRNPDLPDTGPSRLVQSTCGEPLWVPAGNRTIGPRHLSRIWTRVHGRRVPPPGRRPFTRVRSTLDQGVRRRRTAGSRSRTAGHISEQITRGIEPTFGVRPGTHCRYDRRVQQGRRLSMVSFVSVTTSIVIAVVLGSALTGCSNASTRAEADGRAAPAKAVQTDTVRREDVKRTVNVSGTLAAENEVTVSSQAEGVVSRILADLGDRVSAGQALVELDRENFSTTSTSRRPRWRDRSRGTAPPSLASPAHRRDA